MRQSLQDRTVRHRQAEQPGGRGKVFFSKFKYIFSFLRRLSFFRLMTNANLQFFSFLRLLSFS